MNHVSFGPPWSAGEILTISLHGFPALRSQQNREIAERVSHLLHRSVEVPFYTGLGFSPGVFRFSTCLNEVRNFITKKLASHPSEERDLDLLGHSWGGFLSLALAQSPPIAARLRRIVLMSPLLRFGTSAQVQQDLLSVVAATTEVNLGDLEILASDFETLGLSTPPSQLAASLPQEIDVLLLQATDDDVTPPDVATGMVDRFARRPTFELMKNDHGFTQDKAGVASRIAAFLG